jgi:hexosaminidase
MVRFHTAHPYPPYLTTYLTQEIDTPGHTGILSTSHPEHIACAFSTPWLAFTNEPPAGQLRLASPVTSNFTATLISSIAKTLPSTMFSTGGDELNVNCYAMDKETQQELQSSGRTLDQALSAFVQANHAGLARLGKTAVVWEGEDFLFAYDNVLIVCVVDMVLEHAVALRNDTVVMFVHLTSFFSALLIFPRVWISSQHAASVAAKNFHIVHAPSDYFYLVSSALLLLLKVAAYELPCRTVVQDCG